MKIEITTSPTQLKPRIYVWPTGESVIANLANRHNRPIELYREAAKQALKELEITGKLSWTQKAGCSCGCSPGFILSEQTTPGQAPLRADVHVSVVDIAEQELAAETAKTKRSAGRGPSGQLRNFKAMGSDKLSRVIAELTQQGDDAEALVAALRVGA